MTLKIFSVIFFSVGLSAIAQIALKLGMSAPNVQTVIDQNSGLPKLFLTIFSNVYILIGFMMYITGAVLWLFVLSKLDVSLAYPYIGMGFIITMVMGALFLGESLSFSRIVGTLLVVAGVTLISTQAAASS